MKQSDKFAAALGITTAGLGLVAAILCPFAGAIGGGIAVWKAVASVPFIAKLALTGAGVVGGAFVGRVASPIVLVAGSFVAAGVAGLSKLAGVLVKKIASPFKKKPKLERATQPPVFDGQKPKSKFKLSFHFKKSAKQKPANDANAPAAPQNGTAPTP